MAPYNSRGQATGSGGRSPAFSDELEGEPRPWIPRLTPEQRLALIKYRKPRHGLSNPIGKIWNLPNTALGLGYGLTGHLVGELMGRDPRIALADNGIEFIDNPFGGVGAITLGNTTTYDGDPYDRNDPGWYENGVSKLPHGVPPYEHEAQHWTQGEVLGPAYLPSNILGGLYALIRDGDWGGPHNWNEVGPYSDPPRPWRRRK